LNPNGWWGYVDIFSFEGTAGQQIRIELPFWDFATSILLVPTSENSFPVPYLAWETRRIPSTGDYFTLAESRTYYIWVGVDPESTSVSGNYRLSLIGPAASGSVTVVEYYHAGLDHYFITWMPNEIAILDAGTQIRGWTRTGHSFTTYTTPQAGTSPVCRYYIPPGLGDSHFFGRGTVECSATGQKNPTFVLEDPAFMQTLLPAAGICPASTTPVYRVFSNRLDANHRYMTDRTVRDQMVAKGWLAEGDGPDLVVMCAPQ
jgi:hypothetical protein